MKSPSKTVRKASRSKSSQGESSRSSSTAILLAASVLIIIGVAKFRNPNDFAAEKEDSFKIKPLEDILKEALQDEGRANFGSKDYPRSAGISTGTTVQPQAVAMDATREQVIHKSSLIERPKPIVSLTSPSKSSASLSPPEVSPIQRVPSGGYPSMSWDKFIQLPAPHTVIALPSQNERTAPISAAVKTLIQCPSVLVESLAAPVLSKEDFTWCNWALSPSGGQVKVGKSWGKLEKDKSGKEKFDDLNCNAVAQGKNPSCDDEWGDKHVTDWSKGLVKDIKCGSDRTSKVLCYDNNNKDRFCVLENAMIDFRKYRDVDRGPDRTKSRKFDKGFIATDCDSSQGDYFPFKHLYSPSLQSRQCDKVINGTVLMFSHDDFSNIGHTMNDFQNVWLMMWLANRGRYFNETPFLNIDALKLGHSYQDKIGKFHTVYQRDFPYLLRGDDYKGSAVCFQRLLVQPVPPKFFVWGSWFKDSTCSLRGPSSLHQRWNLHLRRSFGQLEDQLNFKSEGIRNVIKILFIVRNVHKNLWGSNRSSRNILNMDDVRATLNSEADKWNRENTAKGLKIDMVFQDLAELSIPQQIALAASSSIIVGTHGAGIVLSNFMPIGKENCCGVFEIYPKGEFSPIRGHGNMARKTGLHYDRMDIGTEHSRSDGCQVDAAKLWSSLARMVSSMREKPTCVLPDVIKDPYLELNRS